MKIRFVDHRDSGDILAWRNDPASLSMFRNSKDVDPDEHQDWFEHSLNDPNRALYMGVEEDRQIGICRFDFDPIEDWAEVSINLNPEERRKGLSCPLLQAAIEAYRETRVCALVANIKKDNIASKRLFEKCGFMFIRDDGELMMYRLDDPRQLEIIDMK